MWKTKWPLILFPIAFFMPSCCLSGWKCLLLGESIERLHFPLGFAWSDKCSWICAQIRWWTMLNFIQNNWIARNISCSFWSDTIWHNLFEMFSSDVHNWHFLCQVLRLSLTMEFQKLASEYEISWQFCVVLSQKNTREEYFGSFAVLALLYSRVNLKSQSWMWPLMMTCHQKIQRCICGCKNSFLCTTVFCLSQCLHKHQETNSCFVHMFCSRYQWKMQCTFGCQNFSPKSKRQHVSGKFTWSEQTFSNLCLKLVHVPWNSSQETMVNLTDFHHLFSSKHMPT